MIRCIGRSAVSCLALAVAGFALVGPAYAGSQVLQYEVEHPTYGRIGTYTNTVDRQGNNVDVETQLHVAVKMLGIPLFRQDADRIEHWQNGRFVGYQSDTDDNGKKIDVTGKAEGDAFVVTSPLGTFTAPAHVHPSNPWSPQLLDTDTMMSTKTGKVMKVVVTDTGMCNVTFDGQSMRVHQYFVDGEKHQVVWLDPDGTVVAFQTQEEGSPINFVLQHQSEPQAAQK
jgi:Domain of unknown function (DUF6134)